MKLKFLVVVAVMCAILFSTVELSRAQVHGATWQEAYGDFLREFNRTTGSIDFYTAQYSVLLHDLSADGVPELIILREAIGVINAMIYSFSANSGTVVRLDEAEWSAREILLKPLNSTFHGLILHGSVAQVYRFSYIVITDAGYVDHSDRMSMEFFYAGTPPQPNFVIDGNEYGIFADIISLIRRYQRYVHNRVGFHDAVNLMMQFVEETSTLSGIDLTEANIPAILSSWSPPPGPVRYRRFNSWQQAYGALLREWDSEVSFPRRMGTKGLSEITHDDSIFWSDDWRFFLYDVDNDGIPEVILIEPQLWWVGRSYMFTFRNGHIVAIETNNLIEGMLSLTAGNDFPGFINVFSDQGTDVFYLLELNNNQLIRRADVIGSSWDTAANSFTWRLDGNIVSRAVFDNALGGVFNTVISLFLEEINDQFDDNWLQRNEERWHPILIQNHEITEAGIQEAINGFQPRFFIPSLSFSSLAIEILRIEFLDSLMSTFNIGMTDIFRIYRIIQPDVYYVIISRDGLPAFGAVIREGRLNGNVIIHVLYHSDRLMTQEELVPQITTAAAIPNISLNPYASFATPDMYTAYLRSALEQIDGTGPNEAAIRIITGFIQNAIRNLSTRVMATTDNTLTITSSDISEQVRASTQIFGEMSRELTTRGIIINLPITQNVVVEAHSINPMDALQITFDQSLAGTLANISIIIRLGSGVHSMSIPGEHLSAISLEYGSFLVRMQHFNNGYTFEFSGYKNGITESIGWLPEPISITLPATDARDTVSVMGRNMILGGLLDISNLSITFATRFPDTFLVAPNVIEIADIYQVPGDEMRNAIFTMLQHGFMSLDENGNFNPSGSLLRQDFASMIVRMFFDRDDNAVSPFVDVAIGHPFYVEIASGAISGLIEGVTPTEFHGVRDITRTEAVTLASRTLVNRRNYSLPHDAELLLAVFNDNRYINYWAREYVALSTQLGIVGRATHFEPNRPSTRAEAAVIMYRLFQMLHESPGNIIQLALPALEHTAGLGMIYVYEIETLNENPDFSSPVLQIVVALVVSVVAAAAGLFVFIVIKNNKIKSPSVKPVQSKGFCRNCGNALTGGGKFCTNCGKEA